MSVFLERDNYFVATNVVVEVQPNDKLNNLYVSSDIVSS